MEIFSLRSQIEKVLDPFISESAAGGCAVGVVHHCELIYQRYWGYADEDAKTPCTKNTIFRLGSVTKVLTALLCLKLVEKKRLCLDQPVQTLLPVIEFQHQWGRAITLRDLLCHGAGIPMDAAFPYWTSGIYPQKRELLQSLSTQKQCFAAGTRFKYSNLGYALIGQIIETATQKTFAENMHTEVFAPLQLASTHVELNTAQQKKVATGYRHGERQIRPVNFVPEYAMSPAGNGVSTVQDMLTLQQVFWNTGDFLQPHTLSEMQRIHQFIVPWKVGYGLGLYLRPHEGGLQMSHGGDLPGHQAQIIAIPEKKLGVVVLSNCEWRTVYILAQKILDTVLTSINTSINRTDTAPDLASVQWNLRWNRYIGEYRDALDRWQILRAREMLYLADEDGELLTPLVPLSERRFLMPQGEYCGEELCFMLDTEGNVERVKYAEEYFYPV